MRNGMRIYSDLEVRDRIELSDGTHQIGELNGLPTTPHTYVPKEPWRHPDPKEWQILLGKSQDSIPYQSIGLHRIPARLIGAWKAIGISDATSEEDIRQVMKHPGYTQTVAMTEEWARQFQLKSEDLTTHRLACIPRELTTVTFNPRENRYLGLHLDSWEKQPLQALASVRNRLCINLGRSDRYFLFINQEINSLQQLLNQPGQTHPRSLIQEFLAEFPEYPVIRIRLKPFEAYIAPTENIIHDGSSLGQEWQDVQITLRSYFTPYRPKVNAWQKLRRWLTPS